MLKFNKNEYLDKLHACWLGKNIGGTMGAPYEGSCEFLDIKGFVNESGEPLPNDDLDLQLVWLNAIEKVGAANFSSNVLADYWLDWISPHFNEYGVCKTNLRLGLLPPMSGELDNEKWRTSNGAWIRSEIWASLAPGLPDIAIKYASMDAMVDHGVSEGTTAEIFTASLQSLAYIENDIKTLINTALSRIPQDSMTAKTIRLVIDCYNNGVPYRETRDRVVEFNKELGWFQAPANIGFVIIGLLYGEGDYKKSLIYAINCGDDTDCTGATVGATLGIIGGTAAIPDELKENVGDRIITLCINGMYAGYIPKSCTELTERIYNFVPAFMKDNKIEFVFTDEQTNYSIDDIQKPATSCELLNRKPYSYDIDYCSQFSVRVEFNDTPRVFAGEERNVCLTFFSKPDIWETRKLQLRLILPEGWSVGNYRKTLTLPYRQPIHDTKGIEKTEFSITAGENVDVINRVYVEVTAPTLAYPVMIPITFIG